MKLSELSAFKAAVCDGGYRTYPAVKIIEYIKEHLPGENFKGVFDPVKTAQKIRSIKIAGDAHKKAVINDDINLLCSRLERLDPNYDLEATIERMSVYLPKMAKHYFDINDYKPVDTKVVEYYFEGYNDLYKDADWLAFNVDDAESKEYNVPVGIYFKRSQISPGYPEFVIMHENVHQFMGPVGADEHTFYYIPWIVEGFADVFGYLMLYRITKDFGLVKRLKNLMMEFDVLDSRKVTYYYQDYIAAQFISSGGLPFTKAFFKLFKSYRHDFDWSKMANAVIAGKTAHEAVFEGYIGSRKSNVEKDMSRWEEEFKRQGDFDDDDKMIFRYFSARQVPATFKASEYRCAAWLMAQLNNNTPQHYVHSRFLNAHKKQDVVKIEEMGLDRWNAIPKGHNSFLVLRDDIPPDLQEAADKLSTYFIIVKKEYGGKIFYDVFGGGMPYRMETGEMRCTI